MFSFEKKIKGIIGIFNWRRIICLTVLMTFSSSIVSPALAESSSSQSAEEPKSCQFASKFDPLVASKIDPSATS